MKHPLITLLTDFGHSDHYVAAMKGALLSVCPEAQPIDVSHEVTPYQIAEAAYLLSQAWSSFPPGSIHVVVVDPGVGSSRRPILVEAAAHSFIAPDNGVLTMALDAIPDYRAWHLTKEQYFRQPVSRTFHGRDIFAPVAGHLANGIAPSALGDEVYDLLRLDSRRPVPVSNGQWRGLVLHVDHFGNIVTSFDRNNFRFVGEQSFELSAGEHRLYRYYRNYDAARLKECFVITGSSGYLEISMKQDSAAKELNIFPGDTLELRTVQQGNSR
ncbi:MAG: SAM-dependent chlorinase/fluorinase [Acidobacteriota bacterium]